MRYLYWLRLYAFPLGLNQGRWNMLHSEYIQLKDRRMTTDPKDAGIARLTTELRVYMDAAEAHAVETMRQRDRAEKAEAERDAALAQVARLHHLITEASDPDFIWGAMDNVNDMDVGLDEFANAASRAIRASIPILAAAEKEASP